MTIHLTVYHSFFTPHLKRFQEYQQSFSSWTNQFLSPLLLLFSDREERVTISIIRLICQSSSSSATGNPSPFLHWIQWRPLIWQELIDRFPHQVTLCDVPIPLADDGGNGKWPQFSFLFQSLSQTQSNQTWKKHGVLWMDHDILWRDSSFIDCFFSPAHAHDHSHAFLLDRRETKEEPPLIQVYFPRHLGSDPRHHPVTETWTEPTEMTSRPGILANGCFLLWIEKGIEQQKGIEQWLVDFFHETSQWFQQHEGKDQDDEIPFHRAMTIDYSRVNIVYLPQWTIYHDRKS